MSSKYVIACGQALKTTLIAGSQVPEAVGRDFAKEVDI